MNQYLRVLTFFLLLLPCFEVAAFTCFDKLAHIYRIYRPGIDELQLEHALAISRPTQHLLGEPRTIVFKEELLNGDWNFIRRQVEKRPIHYVLGPDGNRHIIDRHHTLYTFQEIIPELKRRGYPVDKLKFEYRLIEDLSRETHESFISKMLANQWLYPLNKAWEETIEGIPTEIILLEFDFYRGLAWIVRKSGAFIKIKTNKESTPYLEFIWARAFKDSLDFKKTEFTRKKIRKAIELALSSEGPHTELPGYIQNHLAKGDILPTVDDCMARIDDILNVLARNGLIIN